MPVARHDFLRGGLQVAGPGIVAQALPLAQDIVRVGRGQAGDVGEVLHPAQVVPAGGFDLGLLEHDFRHPDAVRVAGSRRAPRQVAVVRVVPGQKDRRPVAGEQVQFIVRRRQRQSAFRLFQRESPLHFNNEVCYILAIFRLNYNGGVALFCSLCIIKPL